MTSDDDKPISPHAQTVDATAAQDPLVGKRLGSYRIVGRLGAGGMGVVYRAEDEKLRRAVALKVLPDTSGNEERRQRFLREARSAAAITHPNVAVVYQVDEADGRIYIAMELVEGENLAERLARGRLDLATAKDFATQIARGLAAAHEKNLLHRDLKPPNVMVTPAGVVKLLDFGLAKTGVATPESGRTEAELARTETVVTSDAERVIGTPAYMSPEQAAGKPLDVRSDVFSFGIVLYEMLSGVRPFEGESTAAVLAAILRDVPEPLSKLAPGVPVEFATIVERCLAKSPVDRWSDGRDLLNALDGLPASGGVESQVARTVHTRLRPGRWALALGAVAVLGLAVMLVGLLRGGRSRADGMAVVASAGVPATGTTLPGTPSPEAAAAYAEAQSAFRFGDVAAATRSLKRAVAIDPAFPAANVRLALMGSATLAEGRGYYATALRSLDRLDARDQQLLRLEEPWLMDPPNVEMLTARARDMIRAWPSDPEVQYWCGHRLGMTSGEVDESLSALDRALALDPSFVIAAITRARVQLQAGDPEAAIHSADRCLAISPAAARCIGFKAAAHGALGQCDLAEQDLRARMTVEPRAGARYRELAVVLAARRAPVEALQEALRRAKELEPDNVGGAAAGEILLALYAGDFDTAEAKLSALDEATPTGADEGQHDIRALLLLFEERGEPAKAVALASNFMKRWPAWTHNEPGGSRPMVAAILHRAGQITDEAFRAQRSAWLEERASVDGRAFPASVVHWTEFYADPARTPAEADEALEVLAKLPRVPPFRGRPEVAGAAGRTYNIAQRLSDAVPLLVDETSSCGGELDSSLAWIIPWLRDRLLLGQALEQQGRGAEACAQYSTVLARWGHAKPKSVTADEARAHATKLGCGL